MKTIRQIERETSSDVYTLSDFNNLRDMKFITSYDGQGYFHNGEEETNISVWDTTLSPEDIQSKYPYVCWYNK